MRHCVASERDGSGEAAGGGDGGGGEGDTTVPGGGEEVGRGGDGGGGSTGSRLMPPSVMGVATPPQMVLKVVQYEMFSGVPPILPP